MKNIVNLLLFLSITSNMFSQKTVKLIDAEIKKYNKDLKEEKMNVSYINGVMEKIVWFEEKNKISKIEKTYSHSNDFEMSIQLYFKEDIIIKYEKLGVSPYIYKGQKKKNDPCCIINDEALYFFTPKRAVKQYRKLHLYELKNYKKKKKDLQYVSYNYEKMSGRNSKKRYKEIIEMAKKFQK